MKERWLVFNKLDMLAAAEAEQMIEAVLTELDWQGPVYRISALARQGTEQLCYDLMRHVEGRLESQNWLAKIDYCFGLIKRPGTQCAADRVEQ